MNPYKVFGALVAVMAALAAAALLTRPAEPALTQPHPTPTAVDSLTIDDALARFSDLKRMRDRAYRERDASLVTQIYTSTSPRRDTVLKEIQTLFESDVRDKTRFRTLHASVVSQDDGEIIIRQSVMVHPKFVNARGKTITASGRVERQVVEWILHPENGEWKVFDTVIVKASPAK